MNQFNGHGQPGRVMTQQEQLAMMQAQQDQLVLMRAQLEQKLLALVEKNKAGFTELQRRGVNFDPLQLVNARIDSLIVSIANAFGPQGQVWAVQVRLDWETLIAEQIKAAAEQGTRAQLAMGGQFTPGMIRQLAKETGTPGGSVQRLG